MTSNAYQVPRHHGMLYREQVTADPCPNDPGFATEVFHRLYSESPNKLDTTPGNLTRHALHGLIDELPEFDVLRHLTTRDPMWAGMATATLGSKVAPCVPKTANVKKAEDILAGLASMQDDLEDLGTSADKLDQAIAQAEQALEAAQALDASLASSLDESAARTALRAGIGQAVEDIQSAEQALNLLGYGSGTGTGGTSFASNPGVALELARRVKASPSLAEIMALAGRLTRTARAKRAARSEYARSEVVGVEQSGDISRLLGSEMALLNDADMSDDLLIRLTEKRALGFKMSGKEKLAKGPIVLMLDQSGSMATETKDIWAKAIALAIYDAARADKREFAMVLYSDGVLTSKVVHSPSEMLEMISTTPISWHGTNFAPAMAECIKLASTKSDIVHITDGAAPLDGAPEALRAADAMGARVFGIGIGRVGTALDAWSHEVTKIQDVSKDTQAMDLLFGEGGI